ncbi:MAG: molybdate ABC transporter substrate-binding protein [Jatrophihabitans sp.]|nr:MAG: molybdate ABC transporter substrate-binding protein [Jatrophihabitans sp.]
MKRLLLVLPLAAALAACSSSGTGPKASPALSGSITVAAAASLTGTFNAIIARFEKAHPGTHITPNYGGSPELATQIDQGAPVDVFASASTTNMTTVVDAGNASHPVTFVRNTAEIAVARGNPKHIASVADLGRAGVTVALCEANVPCGVVAAAVLAKAHAEVSPAARQPNVKATLALVSSGEVDAAIVYVTDLKAAGGTLTGVPIPASQNTATEYPIAVCTHSTNTALARAFVDYVLSPAGRAVLTAAGFASP